MNQDFFKTQITRLKTRFGEKAFDNEFVFLIWREVKDLSDAGLVRFVDVLLGSRTHNKPPLLSEFREARLAEEKIRFENEARGAARAMRTKPNGGMRAYLAKEFPGCETLNDALKRKIKKANNDPDDAA